MSKPTMTQVHAAFAVKSAANYALVNLKSARRENYPERFDRIPKLPRKLKAALAALEALVDACEDVTTASEE